jgi:flagellar biosynthetic protein FliQ
MDAISFLTLCGEAMRVTALVAGPPIAAAFVVGGIVAMLQAVTQVQEMTITFVPKVVAIVAVMFLAGTASLEALQAFGLRTTELVKEYRNVAGRPG